MDRTTMSRARQLILAAVLCSQTALLFALCYRTRNIDLKVSGLVSRQTVVPVSDRTISFTGSHGLAVTVISTSNPPCIDVSQAYRWWGGFKDSDSNGSSVLAVREIVIHVAGQPVRVPISATSGLTDVKAVSGESNIAGFNVDISGGSEGAAYVAVLRVEKLWFGYAVVWRRIRDNELLNEVQERTEYSYASNRD